MVAVISWSLLDTCLYFLGASGWFLLFPWRLCCCYFLQMTAMGYGCGIPTGEAAHIHS